MAASGLGNQNSYFWSYYFFSASLVVHLITFHGQGTLRGKVLWMLWNLEIVICFVITHCAAVQWWSKWWPVGQLFISGEIWRRPKTQSVFCHRTAVLFGRIQLKSQKSMRTMCTDWKIRRCTIYHSMIIIRTYHTYNLHEYLFMNEGNTKVQLCSGQIRGINAYLSIRWIDLQSPTSARSSLNMTPQGPATLVVQQTPLYCFRRVSVGCLIIINVNIFAFQYNSWKAWCAVIDLQSLF